MTTHTASVKYRNWDSVIPSGSMRRIGRVSGPVNTEKNHSSRLPGILLKYATTMCKAT
jgi:hypothetical protein